MPEKIIINYGALDARAKTITEHNDKMKSILHDIQNLINSLEGDFESNSAVEIRRKITEMESVFQNYYNMVDNFAIYLRNLKQGAIGTEGGLTENAKRFP